MHRCVPSQVAQQCKENIFAIQTLKDFQYLDDNKDQGINVREKAKALVALLKDDERLKNERVRALKAKERFAQNTAGIGSDTVVSWISACTIATPLSQSLVLMAHFLVTKSTFLGKKKRDQTKKIVK